jgi:hypothetical protein
MSELSGILFALKLSEDQGVGFQCTGVQASDLLCHITALQARIDALESEIRKWQKFHPSDEDLLDAKKQAQGVNKDYMDSLGANSIYIGLLEQRLRERSEQIDALTIPADIRETVINTLRMWQADIFGTIDSTVNIPENTRKLLRECDSALDYFTGGK